MRRVSVSVVCVGVRSWVVCALLALASCHDATTDLEHQDLADEMFSTATAYRSTMCTCKTAACAEDLDGRFQSWTRQMQAKIGASDQRSSYAATISEDGAKRFDAIIAEYQDCRDELLIKRALGR